jgi:hypothetical protein
MPRVTRTRMTPRFDPFTGEPVVISETETTYQFRGVEYEHQFIALESIPTSAMRDDPRQSWEIHDRWVSILELTPYRSLETVTEFFSLAQIEVDLELARKLLFELGFVGVEVGVFAISKSSDTRY